MITLDQTEVATFTALRSFLLAILPTPIDVVRGQVNRVAEPLCPNFVVMTATNRVRLATNRDSYADASLTGSIAGGTLTVSAVDFGEVHVGAPVLGDGIAANTAVTALGTGTGGVGTYTVTPTQSVTSRALFAGLAHVAQSTQITIQLDVHGPLSADNAQRISTLLRDDYACLFFERTGSGVVPLFAGEPMQAPFVNGEVQVEYRWTLDAVLQAQPVVTYPLEFAADVSVGLHQIP